jgi:hypothetical protein
MNEQKAIAIIEKHNGQVDKTDLLLKINNDIADQTFWNAVYFLRDNFNYGIQFN